MRWTKFLTIAAQDRLLLHVLRPNSVSLLGKSTTFSHAIEPIAR